MEDGRRDRMRLVATMRQDTPAIIQRAHLPLGTAAQRVRWLDRDVIQVNETIPDTRALKVAAHLLSGHGTVGMADAFGAIACDQTCSASVAWFARECPSQASSGA